MRRMLFKSEKLFFLFLEAVTFPANECLYVLEYNVKRLHILHFLPTKFDVEIHKLTMSCLVSLIFTISQQGKIVYIDLI